MIHRLSDDCNETEHFQASLLLVRNLGFFEMVAIICIFKNMAYLLVSICESDFLNIDKLSYLYIIIAPQNSPIRLHETSALVCKMSSPSC